MDSKLCGHHIAAIGLVHKLSRWSGITLNTARSTLWHTTTIRFVGRYQASEAVIEVVRPSEQSNALTLMMILIRSHYIIELPKA
jgi:hypothetical protein